MLLLLRIGVAQPQGSENFSLENECRCLSEESQVFSGGDSGICRHRVPQHIYLAYFFNKINSKK